MLVNAINIVITKSIVHFVAKWSVRTVPHMVSWYDPWVTNFHSIQIILHQLLKIWHICLCFTFGSQLSGLLFFLEFLIVFLVSFVRRIMCLQPIFNFIQVLNYDEYGMKYSMFPQRDPSWSFLLCYHNLRVWFSW